MLNSHENKTIWVLNYFAGTPLSGWGERHFYFAKYWNKKGYKVIIFSSSFNHMFSNMPTIKKKFTREIYEGIEFVWVKTPVYDPRSIMRFWSQMVFAWRVRNLSSSVFGIPDTIIVSSMPIFSIWSGVLLKKNI